MSFLLQGCAPWSFQNPSKPYPHCTKCSNPWAYRGYFSSIPPHTQSVQSAWPNATFLENSCVWSMERVLISKLSQSDNDFTWPLLRYNSSSINTTTFAIKIHKLWNCPFQIHFTHVNIKISQGKVKLTIIHPSFITEYLLAMTLGVWKAPSIYKILFSYFLYVKSMSAETLFSFLGPLAMFKIWHNCGTKQANDQNLQENDKRKNGQCASKWLD